ncbi:uncharacterized protein THITE_2129847 [Thermothielavioides terrestris NRRL 8126]|uniref:Uncharacterized protein n=1 Tax=Thermothielavioides terrestris (strain ATCC 38088 / NRRL 8126) TaxID=578455 RepID=G2R7Z3_THETT|nr:uncharacterized protein THITE_2129847 [Thermothielavioides terrestris NRRL 8126]AEO68052.1 hypothetical protein THITE_2129847 [Thermothielavioides terrestris NRRL 8126]
MEHEKLQSCLPWRLAWDQHARKRRKGAKTAGPALAQSLARTLLLGQNTTTIAVYCIAYFDHRLVSFFVYIKTKANERGHSRALKKCRPGCNDLRGNVRVKSRRSVYRVSRKRQAGPCHFGLNVDLGDTASSEQGAAGQQGAKKMARSLLQVPADARQIYVKDPRQETRVLELNAGKGSTRR